MKEGTFHPRQGAQVRAGQALARHPHHGHPRKPYRASSAHSCRRSESIKRCWDSCRKCRRFTHDGHENLSMPSYIGVFNSSIRETRPIAE